MPIDQNNHDPEKAPDFNNKAKSYFGLLIVLTFLILMHLQVDLRQLGERGGFFQKTFTNALVWKAGRGSFVRNYETKFNSCEYARQGVVNSTHRDVRMREACDFLPIVVYSYDSLDRIRAFDPEYEANSQQYYALLKQAKQEKTDVFSSPQTKDIAEKLLKSVHTEYVNAQTWLVRMNIFSHLMVVILSLIGLRYRRGLGHMVSTPFRWAVVAGKHGIVAAKDIHNRI